MNVYYFCLKDLDVRQTMWKPYFYGVAQTALVGFVKAQIKCLRRLLFVFRVGDSNFAKIRCELLCINIQCTIFIN